MAFSYFDKLPFNTVNRISIKYTVRPLKLIFCKCDASQTAVATLSRPTQSPEDYFRLFLLRRLGHTAYTAYTPLPPPPPHHHHHHTNKYYSILPKLFLLHTPIFCLMHKSKFHHITHVSAVHFTYDPPPPPHTHK